MTRLATLLALVVLASCSHPKEAEVEPVVPVQVTEVKRGPIQRIVAAQAILYPVDQANVVPKITAPIRTFYIKRGDTVAKDQLLAALENRDLRAAVADAKGAYDQAESALRTATAATVPEDITKAQGDVESSRQAMEAAQKVYESRKQLFEQGALARRLVEEANTAYVQAKSQYEIAQRHLQAVQGVTRQEQVKAAQAQADSAKAKYEGAQVQLSYSEVRSPIGGVIADRPLYAGELATAGSPLLTVMDVSRVIARANIPVEQASAVKVGDPATISVTDGSVKAPGKVTVVSPAVDPNSTTVEVWIEAPNPKAQLKPGTTVHVEILAGTIPDAVLIPETALLPTPEGPAQVMVVTPDNIAHGTRIEPGVRQDGMLQVVKGLEAGQKVITVGGVGLEDGAKVKVRTQSDAEKAGGDSDDKKDKPSEPEGK